MMQHSPGNAPVVLALARKAAAELDTGPHAGLSIDFAEVLEDALEAEGLDPDIVPDVESAPRPARAPGKDIRRPAWGTHRGGLR